VVSLVWIVGMVLALQGWKSRDLTFDLLPYVDSAHEFLATWSLPDRGTLTSYASYAPPGISWLILPGVYLFDDPRLYEYVGSSALYLGTLIGIFAVAKMFFGVECAALSVLLYGLSELGLFYSRSLWPRGHPFFYVWFVYWVAKWVTTPRSGYLAAAIFTWAAGMYVFMEVAPAIFVLPLVWLFYRPPISLKPVLVASICTIVLWFPYLRLEANRGFVDLKSQVLRQDLLGDDFRRSWCDPTLALVSSDVNAGQASASQAPASKFSGTFHLLTGNFSVHTHAMRLALLLLIVGTCMLILATGTRTNTPEPFTKDALWNFWLGPFAICIILAGAVANEWTIARFGTIDGVLESPTILKIRVFQSGLFLIGLLLIFRNTVFGLLIHAKNAFALLGNLRSNLQLFLERSGMDITRLRHGPDARLLVLSLAIPWLTLLVAVEDASHLERFWWLWPMQVIILAAAATSLRPTLRLPRIAGFALAASLIGLIVVPQVSDGVNAVKNGWSGSDSDDFRTADYLARQIAPRKEVALGYQTFIWRFMAQYNVVDPRYKIGADFDLLFRDLHGVSNIDRCAEGVSPNDEFRIIQSTPPWTDPVGKGYVEVPEDKNFQFLEQIGSYRIYKRL
jgi:hypothetical protein